MSEESPTSQELSELIRDCLNNAKLTNIIVHTAFNNRGYNGYSRKVLLSGICKYYRREYTEKFVWCVIEMLLFKYHEKGIGLVTNVLNRLRILIMEEILFCNKVHRIIEMIQLIEHTDHRNISIETLFQRVLSFCKLVSKRPKSRGVSYYRSWYKYENEGGLTDADIDENEIDYDELDAAMDTFLLRLNPKDIMDTMNHIKTKYGSFNVYFDSIGFYENDRQRLKTALSIYNSSSL